MPKRSSDNLRIKRRYLLWLADARGLSEASIDKAAASISVFEAHLAGKDFRAFHVERARAFKRLLSQRDAATGRLRSGGTINGILRDVMSFYRWLADQPGYKSRINRSDVDYLAPDKKSETTRRTTCWKPHPSPEQARRLLGEMPTSTLIERRDRAFVAFLFLTGSRVSAAISLRLGHVDLSNACVHFDGGNVDTKFGKRFSTGFFPIGSRAEEIFREWVSELRSDLCFSDADPLFPKTKVAFGSDQQFCAVGVLREPWASASSATRIFKEAFRDAGLPPFSPHRVRDTLAELAREFCRTPEDYKAWSQNMGHDDVLTTFRSYGSVAPGRQMELVSRFRRRGPLTLEDDLFE